MERFNTIERIHTFTKKIFYPQKSYVETYIFHALSTIEHITVIPRKFKEFNDSNKTEGEENT